MIDTHCHILPGLDDGPPTMTDAVALCQQMADQGVRKAIATPHQLGCFRSVCSSAIREKTNELNTCLIEKGIDLAVFAGAEVRLDERIEHLLQLDQILTLADGGSYLLLETASDAEDVWVDFSPLLISLKARGITVVLAHTERNLYLRHCSPNLLNRWLDLGLVIQVTTAGLSGQWGPSIKNFAWYLVFSGRVGVIGSDAHDTVVRPCKMAEANRLITSCLGNKVSHRLFEDHPQCILQGDVIQPLFGASGILPRITIAESQPEKQNVLGNQLPINRQFRTDP